MRRLLPALALLIVLAVPGAADAGTPGTAPYLSVNGTKYVRLADGRMWISIAGANQGLREAVRGRTTVVRCGRAVARVRWTRTRKRITLRLSAPVTSRTRYCTMKTLRGTLLDLVELRAVGSGPPGHDVDPY